MSDASSRQDLIERRAALAAAEPGLRARDIATRLGISEAELLALGAGGMTVTRLRPEWTKIIAAVPALGRVMALTRNASVVHERKGVYGALEGGAHVGLIVGEDIDLRIFFTQWKSGFGVVERLKEGGDALIAQFAAEDMPLDISPAPEKRKPLADSEIDVAGFRAAWDAMKDTHEFHGLVTKFKVERLQGLRLAGASRAVRVPAASLRATLETARDRDVPIMVFVGNPGMIQIHTGAVSNLKPMGPWFNVLDEAFNLHLREDHIDSAWVVWKPTEDGTVTSLELFDKDGTLIATLFGKRKPGQPEDLAWREIVNGLTAKEAA